ncbi:MAG: PadR family transcriptional regulator [Acidimicrobiales bacterium]
MLDLAILGLLRDRELHGYELKKQLHELLGARGTTSFGSLYPALARLEKAGLVKAVEAETRTATFSGKPVPSSGSRAGELAAFRARRAVGRATGRGRGRKVYGITEAGEAQLLALLADPTPTDDRTFAVKVALCRHLPAADRLALFERRRAELLARHHEHDRRRPDGNRDGLLDRYLRSLRDRDALTLSHDLAWLDELIAHERAALQEDLT